MGKIVTCKTYDGNTVEYDDEKIESGTMKDVYFSPDKSYVVCFYREKQSPQSQERLSKIVNEYKDRFFNSIGGEYWKKLFCWPTAMLEHEGKLGLVAPVYNQNFFFEFGSKNNDFHKIKGKEKKGKWFASPKHRSKTLAPQELGDWQNYIRICLLLARAVRRMHFAGLAHSDLSYNNVLIDPCKGEVCIIDIDGLVVPGKYAPDVVGTQDFIAPEVIKTSHLAKGDPKKNLPKQETDNHALAVLIYLYLLYRHPLEGRKVHDIDDEQRDTALRMGENALFIEHPTDKSNSINTTHCDPFELPWKDTTKLPFTITGPYLKELFLKAFVEGLHAPEKRPSANDWETALVKTVDLLLPCSNSSCEQKWFVYNNSQKPCCPFCDTPFKEKFPIMDFYSKRAGKFTDDKHRLVVYTNQPIYAWHTNNLVVANEKLSDEQRRRVGYFVFHDKKWWLVNERLNDLFEITGDTNNQKEIPIGSTLEIKDGQKILFSKENGGRLACVRIVNG